MNHTFGHLRELVHQPPSEESWRAIMEVLASVEGEQRRAELVPYAQRYLQAWPEELRELDVPTLQQFDDPAIRQDLAQLASRLHVHLGYYGAGLSGRTTSIKFLYSGLDPEKRPRKLGTEIALGLRLVRLQFPIEAKNYRLVLRWSSTPGSLFVTSAQRLPWLQTLDGLIWMVDSQRERLESALVMAANLKNELEAIGRGSQIPWVVQFNKRDLPNAMPIEELRAAIRERGFPELLDAPSFESIAVAPDGIGVFETAKTIVREVLRPLLPPNAKGS